MIRELGGYFTHMDCIWFYVYATPDYRDPQQRRGLVFRMVPGYIWFNQQGRRFHNESLTGGASATPALLRADSAPRLGDRRHADAGEDRCRRSRTTAAAMSSTGQSRGAARTIRRSSRKPTPSKSSASRCGFDDVNNFVAEVERYNKCFDANLDKEPKFGKSLKASKKFDTPPYYAIQIFPLARKNFGGVKTDLRCRALNKYFEPIPGLYAAGEVAGMAGGHINGKAGLEGTMLGPSIFSGRVAGAWAAHEAGFGPGFIGKPNRPELD